MVEVHEKETITIRMADGSEMTVAASDVVEAVKRSPTLKATELAVLVSAMRKAQKEYFRTKNLAVLDQSKKLEKQVDDSCAAVLDGQKNLFDS